MIKRIFKQTSSFGVLRANPRISGNVKITIDSNGDIWLNSIDSNSEMSKEKYKGYRITENSSYDKDLYYFFDKGKTLPEYVFGVYGEEEPIQNQLKDIKETYDFRYSTGVSLLNSPIYKEEFAYFAPLYLKEDIPDYFVIFNVKDPIDYSYKVPVNNLIIGKQYKVIEYKNVNKSDPNYEPFKIKTGIETYTDGDIFEAKTNNFHIIQGQGEVVLLDPLYHLSQIEDIDNHFRNYILPKAKIIATFDLTENSKIGKYLRNIKSNSGYTSSLIDVKFEKNQLTTYNGVNYELGIFDKKGEYLFDFFSKPTSQIEFEEYITNGFKRNKIISYLLLNLEFLFNDNDSKDYTINRYFGLYVNSIELGTFRLDGNALFQDRGQSGNRPIPEVNNKGYYYQEQSFYQYNDNGVRLFIDPNSITGILPNSDDINIKESNKLFWIKDKNGNFYSFKRDINYNLPFSTSSSKYGLTGTENQIVIQNTLVDLSSFTGFDYQTRKQYSSIITGEKGRSYSVIKINGQLTNNTKNTFIFYHPLGSYGMAGEKYDIIQTSDLSSIIDEWGPGSYYIQDNVYYIHPFGEPQDIARALTNVFNNFQNKSFEAFQNDNEVIIRIKNSGSKENKKYAIDFYDDYSDPLNPIRMPDNKRNIIFINDKDVCDINQKQFFIGGSDHSLTRIKIKKEDAEKIKVGKTFIKTIKKTNTDIFHNNLLYTNASIVIGKYRFVDQYNYDKNKNIIGLKDIDNYMTIEVMNNAEMISIDSFNKITSYDIFDISFGIFSFYGLRELDGDFWNSEYNYTPTEEYYKHLDVQPEGKTKIIESKTYYVAKGAEIEYNGNNITGPNIFIGVSNVENYKLLSSTSEESANVYPTLSTRNSILYNNNNIQPNELDSKYYPDFDSFPGFYGIQSLSFIDNDTTSNFKKDQLLFGKLKSEYDYTQDNYNKNYTIKSRINPYIVKWVYENGTDIRGNEYRLNSNLAFGPLNFSPSFFRQEQDSQYFTHEWFQLMNPPYSLPEENLFFDKSYLDSLNEDRSFIDSSELIMKLSNANPINDNYFLKYFTIEGEDFKKHYPHSSKVKNINYTERFSIFKFNENTSNCETFFRGTKIRIKKLYKDYTENAKIKYIKDNSFYNNYKFTCLLIPVEDNKKIQSPFKIKVIENRTFKTIILILEVVLDDARIQVREGINNTKYLDIDYFLLYALKDKIDSNYNITINNIPIELPIYKDIKLSSTLNITDIPNENGLVSYVNNSEGRIYIIPNPEYETDLREEINFIYHPSTNATNSGYGSSTGPGSFYGYYPPHATSNLLTYTFPFPVGIGKNYIDFKGINNLYQFNFELIGFPFPQNIPIFSNISMIKDIPIYQKNGGKNYWKNILKKISFANISLLINTNNPYIEYISYVWDEETKNTKVIYNDFSLEFVKPSVYIQDEILITEEEKEKPQELSSFFIGYKLRKIKKETELYRYSGSYIPKFREILKFENIKNDELKWMLSNIINYPSLNKSLPTYIVTVGPKLLHSLTYDLGSNNCFYINNKPQKKITLIRGKTYVFKQEDISNSNNQLYFSLNNRGKSFPDDALLDNYIYYGVAGTNNNPFSGVLITVPYTWPDKIYYVSAGDKYMGGEIKIVDSIEFCNCTFGPSKQDFGKINNINYYKYSDEWIFKINKDSSYNPIYNLIGETLIDKRNLSLFQSSWDTGFYRKYKTSTEYIDIPGIKDMKEQKSFFGSKALKLPNVINIQKQKIYPHSINNIYDFDFNIYPEYEIFWEDTKTEIKGILLIDRMIINYFLQSKLKNTFENFIIPEFCYESYKNINDVISKYIIENIISILECKNIDTYIKKINTKNNTLNNVIVGNYSNYQKLLNGYYIYKDIKYTKINDLKYEFHINKDISYDYSVGFSIEINKI